MWESLVLLVLCNTAPLYTWAASVLPASTYQTAGQLYQTVPRFNVLYPNVYAAAIPVVHQPGVHQQVVHQQVVHQPGVHQQPLTKSKSALDTEKAAEDFVNEAEAQLLVMTEKTTYADWAYEANITDETEALSLSATAEYQALANRLGLAAKRYDLDLLTDEITKRKLRLLGDIGTSILPPDTLTTFNKLTSSMSKIYSSAKVKDYKNLVEDYSLEPELTREMAESRDPALLEYYWTQWREQSGKQIRALYGDYVAYYNQAARLNGFRDASEMKVQNYESDTFKEEMASTWEGLKPLYQQLHAYVRSKLNNFYGSRFVSNDGPIPAHLLGNMWAQSWNNLADILQPYPDKPSLNVTGEMVRQGWTQKIMFEKAEDFFLSLGLDPMVPEFWSGSIIEKPEDDRELVCHASAWDFYNGKDFRIKQCTVVNQEDFVTVNHEMGHVQYFMQYKNQSVLFRNGANHGFHEGVADILSLSVGTASYFKQLGLLSEDVDVEDDETDINILFGMALERIAFLPFGYMVDKFRWDVFSGETSKENMNCHWWKLRHEIQGLTPPNKRSYLDFDAGAKYHVAGDVGYVRYFTAFIYEFQFYKALCEEAGEYIPGDPAKPLHRCNIYGSKAAGDKMRDMLKLGASRPWKEAMRVMTGQPEMDTGAIREYFRPLENWLIQRNKENNVQVGWGDLDLDSVCQQA